jgi:hypothetical protein
MTQHVVLHQNNANEQQAIESKGMFPVNASLDHMSATLETHLTSCESFRKINFGIIALVVGLMGSSLGFLISELYEIKGRQDGVIQRLENIDRLIIANRDDATNRFSSVVNANTQRESTFNERFKSVDQSLNEIRKQLYDLERATWRGGQPEQQWRQQERR